MDILTRVKKMLKRYQGSSYWSPYSNNNEMFEDLIEIEKELEKEKDKSLIPSEVWEDIKGLIRATIGNQLKDYTFKGDITSFGNLNTLNVGDKIEIMNNEGICVVFQVYQTFIRPPPDFPENPDKFIQTSKGKIPVQKCASKGKAVGLKPLGEEKATLCIGDVVHFYREKSVLSQERKEWIVVDNDYRSDGYRIISLESDRYDNATVFDVKRTELTFVRKP